MQGFHARAAVAGDERARWLRRRFGQELRSARLSVGLTQSAVARLARMSQAQVSRAELGIGDLSLSGRCRLAAAVGHELGWSLFPIATVRLRDSGQLAIAQAIASAASPSWTVRLEEPVAPGDPRAADMVLVGATEIVQIEIERALFDVQAQLRRGLLKREALTQRHDRPVRFVLAVPDTARNRRHLTSLEALVRRTLPVTTKSVWARIHDGHPVGADGLLILRLKPPIPPGGRMRG